MCIRDRITTGEKYSGGRYILADAPLDKVPVFIKEGAIIPVADGEIRSTEDITEAVSYTHLAGSAVQPADHRGQETADTPCHSKAESFRAGSPALQNL